MLKSVEFSYPSSSNAERFGFAKTGCYTVETIKPHPTKGCVTKAIAAYATHAEAVKHAETLPYDWSPWYKKFGNIPEVKDKVN